MIAYHKDPESSAHRQHPNELYHKNGDRKSNSELEEELLEEPFCPKIRRYVVRNAFFCEVVILLTSIQLLIKCLARLNFEIGTLDEKAPQHPVFWLSLALTGVWLIVEVSYLDSIETLASKCSQYQREESQAASWMERMTHSLTQPLISSSQHENNSGGEDDMQRDEESGEADNAADAARRNCVRSDIGGDANYKAKWADLFLVCAPDKYWLMCACVFLILSALANVYVPKFTGQILDALVKHSSDNPSAVGDGGSGGSILNIPDFISNVEKLVVVSILGGVFGGVRGAIFTVVGARVNVRLRLQLMESLLTQDISFFEMTRTGDLTSRLSSDTTLVGSQVTTSVNIFLRSIVRAVGVLIFMFLISWQLSLLAFLTVPAVSVLSKWYGKYVRRLSKLQQKKLAEGNAVSESAISSMATVRAFGAESVELDEFERSMENYLTLNIKTAIATFGYSTCVQALPQLMKALVLFYGGLLVQSDGPHHITGGQLVTFILYLTSLSESFNSLGGIFASLTRAVGAADKVFELMHRKPRILQPSQDADEDREIEREPRDGMLGLLGQRTTQLQGRGLRPTSCAGEIVFNNVDMRYPSRPHRAVLENMNLTIPSGSIVALVGASGSGKSSVVSLIQHLYDPTGGDVVIDGMPVHEFSPEWLHRNVSVVSQEPTLFARSVRKNIIYGLEGTEDEPSEEDIIRAAELANAASFIERLPFGYESEIGERGVQLSGGQKQRLAIARALVRKPKILLLDEATSALDSESEALVQEAIDGMITGQRSLDEDPARSMTVIIVAHRLSTVQNADCIFVMDEGKVIEQGSHNELVQKKGGAYNSLISRQIMAQKTLSRPD
jgi:ATP-binding cassette subfamily B (MDR/TAP) protein 9